MVNVSGCFRTWLPPGTAHMRLAEPVDVSFGGPTRIAAVGANIRARLHHSERERSSGKDIATPFHSQEWIDVPRTLSGGPRRQSKNKGKQYDR